MALTGPGRHCRAARNTLVCPWLLPRGNPIVYLSTSWNDRHNILNGCTSWPLSPWVKLRGLSVAPKHEIGVESTSCCYSDKPRWSLHREEKSMLQTDRPAIFPNQLCKIRGRQMNNDSEIWLECLYLTQSLAKVNVYSDRRMWKV